MSSILVVDDELNIRRTIQELLTDEGNSVEVAGSAQDARRLVLARSWDAILLDIWLPDSEGLETLEFLRDRFPETPVLMISGHASIGLAVKATQMGAFDFLEKPLSSDRLLTSVRNAIEARALREENTKLRRKLGFKHELVGQSPAMLELREQIERAARSDASVYISGENGTGKELVAHAIHSKSRRSGGPFVGVNCAAIPETLIESELFGHEKGAFTGAVGQRKGKFELANRGTLFLDEILDLSLAAQAKVLRATQERVIERIGSSQPFELDVRFIAASNKSIKAAISEGEFREDLYYRIHVLPILVPPLRERREDIPLLAEHFLKIIDVDETKVLSAGSLALLREFAWPGNVRQLRNVIERVVAMCVDDVIDEAAMSDALDFDRKLHSQPAGCESGDDFAGMSRLSLSEAKESFEKSFILHKLEETGYNITKAAQELGMYPSNLHMKIKKYDIQVTR